MRIGCLGLFSDPPHWGHAKDATILLKSGHVDEVWFIPALQHPFQKAETVSAAQRLLMCRMMCEMVKDPRIKVSDVEFERGGISYTANTLRYLRQKYSEHTFYWYIGSDIITTGTYKKWHMWEEELRHEDKIFLVERPGYPLSGVEVPECFAVVGKVDDEPLSSTTIRQMVREGMDIEKYTGEKIAEYIREHKLYQKGG